jgi:hypothetical protein
MANQVKRSHCKLPKSTPILVALLVSTLPATGVRGQVPGERPPSNILKLSQPAMDEGRRALEAEDHVFRPTLLDAVKRGLNQAADETLSHGFTGTWTDNFARGLLWIGENRSWRDAMNVNLNASGKNGAPTPGFAILPVLEGIQKQASKP